MPICLAVFRSCSPSYNTIKSTMATLSPSALRIAITSSQIKKEKRGT
jgi:hypothetical protein